MPRAAAISSCPRPANWRSSITLAATGSSTRQPVEGVVEGEEIVVRVGGGRVGEVDPAEAAAPFLPGLAPGGLDQDVPHGLGCRGEEVAPAVPLAVRGVTDQPQVRLVHQGRGLERLPRRLVRQLPGRQATELVVDQGEQLLGRLTVALLDRRENPRRLAHRRVTIWFQETAYSGASLPAGAQGSPVTKGLK